MRGGRHSVTVAAGPAAAATAGAVTRHHCSPARHARCVQTRPTDVKGQTFVKQMNITEAQQNVEAMAKSIYEGLFLWVVRRINRTLFVDEVPC